VIKKTLFTHITTPSTIAGTLTSWILANSMLTRALLTLVAPVSVNTRIACGITPTEITNTQAIPSQTIPAGTVITLGTLIAGKTEVIIIT